MSAIKKNERSDNSFSQLINGSYVQLFNFIIDPITKCEYTIVKIVHTVNLFEDNCKMIRKIISIDEEKMAVETNDICKICVHMVLNNCDEYLCVVPNLIMH